MPNEYPLSLCLPFRGIHQARLIHEKSAMAYGPIVFFTYLQYIKFLISRIYSKKNYSLVMLEMDNFGVGFVPQWSKKVFSSKIILMV